MAISSKITDKHLRDLRPDESEQIVGDGGGLWIGPLPAARGGAINFYHRSTFTGNSTETRACRRRHRPMLVFGTGTMTVILTGIDPYAHLSLLGAFLAVSSLVGPWAACAALRVALD
jgi:hypothetical protein